MFLTFVPKLYHNDTRAVAFSHELTIIATQVKELLRDGNYLQPLSLSTGRGSQECEPLTSG